MAGRVATLSPRTRTALAVAVLLALVAIPLRGLLLRQGPPMEEGFMLVFGERFLHGDVPNRDFLHLYGPGAVWMLAGAFKAFGTTLVTERIVGLLQILGIVFGVFLVARPWGRRVALGGALVTGIVIVPPIGLAALAWNGGVALALFGILAALHARRASSDRRARALATTSGVLFGLALLYRPDLVLAIGLVLWFVLRSPERPPNGTARRLLVALGATLSLFLIHMAMAGIGNSVQGMVIQPLFELRGGRSLPIPPNWNAFDGFLNATGDIDAIGWPVPRLPSPAQLFVWFFLLLGAVAFLVAVARRLRLAEPNTARALTLVVVAAFSVGLLPQALQRPDTTHLAWVSCVPFGFLPAAALEVVRARYPRLRPARQLVVSTGSVVLALFVLIPNFTFRDYVDISLETFNVQRLSYKIEHDGRVFYYGRPDVPRELAQILPLVDKVSRPGDRLFVGPDDLRKTPYSDAFLYYMLPQLVPATYYIEMDPGVANAPDSRLTKDLGSADIVILSRVWDHWKEPNDSSYVGPDTPNRVLRARFCAVKKLPLFELYVRCTRLPNSGRAHERGR